MRKEILNIKSLTHFMLLVFFYTPLINETNGMKWVANPLFYKLLLSWAVFKYKINFELSNEYLEVKITSKTLVLYPH